MSGVLAGTVLFSTPGKWRVYIAVYAVEGGDPGDSVSVVFNGQPIQTFTNDFRGGFPYETMKGSFGASPLQEKTFSAS